MANEFVAKNGLISQNNTTVSGSLTVTQGITGSLFGTATTASYADNGSETLQEIINNSIVSNEIIGNVNSYDAFIIKEQDTNNGLYIYGSNTTPNKSVWIGTDGSSISPPSPAIGIDPSTYVGGVVIRGLVEVTSSNFIITYDLINGGPISYISASSITFPYTGSAIITGSLSVTGSISTTGDINNATPTEIGYLSGSTSNLQTQLNGRLTSDATVLGYNSLGSAIKGYPLGINLTAVGASTGMTNQRLWLIPVYVPADSVIAGVRWLQTAVPGAYTANNYNGVGLYSVSGGTINIAVSSSNNGNIWKTFSANTWGTQSFTTPYSASKGSYFIGAVLNATGQPSPSPAVGNVAIAAATVQSFDFTGGRLYNILATQLTMPTSVALSTTTGVTTGWYFALY